MAEHQTSEIHGKRVERVGAIVVHGIGEQKRFEFLEGETRKIVDAIIGQYGADERRREVTPTLTTGTGDAFLGAHSSWASGAEAPLHTIVELDDGRIVDIAFHEVWWADINETLTLGKQIRFWWWGLSLPGTATNHKPFLTGAQRTRLPKNSGWLPWHNRFRMAFVSMLFGFSAFSIALINVILKRLNFSPLLSSDILVNYLSGVKLYSQDKRAGGSPMDGPDEPPRAAIRRRMIRVMIDVAREGYDRWYILAHSLGTIVAWNGLMEIQQALPNYLDRKCWAAMSGSPLRSTLQNPFPVDAMMPSRPLWLNDNEIISRDALFERFRGILTYGSPLERFCALWSTMVPINVDEDPFRASDAWRTEWVNVYDPTDPVGTWIYDYDPIPPKHPRHGHTTLTPQNFPCRASPILLYSHIQYLRTPKPGAPNAQGYLVNQIARWLVTGDSLTEQIENAVKEDDSAFWMPRRDDKDETRKLVFGRLVWRWTQDAIVAVLLALLTVFSLNKVIYPAVTSIADWLHASWLTSAIDRVLKALSFSNSYWGNILIEIIVLVIGTALVVALASWIQYSSSTKDHEELAETYRRRMRKGSERNREAKGSNRA